MKIKNLKKRGWTESEIHKIETFHDKSNSKKDLNRLIYWLSLLIMMICNFGIALFLVPFLIMLGTSFSLVIVICLGLVFGTLYSNLVADIEHLSPSHHIFAMIFIPLVALSNIYMMTNAANIFARFLLIETQHNPIVMSSLYIISFLLPYFIVSIRER